MEEILTFYRELRGLFDENDLAMDFRQRIHRIIQETIDQIPSGSRIAIRPAGWDTRELLEAYDFSAKNIVGIVNRRSRGGDFCGYPCFTADSFSAAMCDCMIISSLYYRQEIKEELEALQIPYIDFYDELEKQGIQLRVPSHFYESNIQLVVNYFYLRYMQSEAGPQRETALRELLQIAVDCKDFTLISNIYQACGGEHGEFPLLKAAWRKSKQLLDCIQNKIWERKQKDIILFWADSVPYDMLHCLPGTVELSKQGTFFQRAYTNTPYTSTAMRAMFCNTLPIDDFPQNQEEINSGNSPLIRFMENKGYKVRVIGGSELPMGRERLIEEDYYLSSCNIKWWRGITDLLQSPEPCFYILHLMESHPPCHVPDLKEPVNIGIATRTQQEVQVQAAFKYLDQCMLLYHKLFGNKIQIFFSDHGQHMWVDMPWQEQRLRPFCFVVGENIPKKTAVRFFPYRNFEKLVRWLLDPTCISLEDICTDEVIFQDTDFYNQRLIDDFIRKNNPRKGIAYRGILTYEYKYVLNAVGEEFFYQMQQDGSEELVPLEDSALRDELRDKAGTEFLDIDRYEIFNYAKKLYDCIKSNETQST